jgi:hypothetical protein
MMTPDLIGAFICWILKGCRTNLFKDEWNIEKEVRNRIIAYVLAFILLISLFVS